jgi:hypothetical protein
MRGRKAYKGCGYWELRVMRVSSALSFIGRVHIGARELIDI